MNKNMDAVTKNRWRNFFGTSRTNKLVALVVGLGVIAAGGYFLARSFAAGYLASINVQQGTISGSAQIVKDTNGNSVVQFNAPVVPPAPPTGGGGGPVSNGGWPAANNTGYPHGLPGDSRKLVTLTPYTGPMDITKDGTVLDSVYIAPNQGILTIDAKNVVIKNSYIRGSNLEASNNKEIIRSYHDDANLLIEDTEVSGLSDDGKPTDASSGGQPGIGRTGYTLLRVNAHDYGDILRTDGNAKVTDSYLHDPTSASTGDPHDDVVQSTNATSLYFDHNYLSNPGKQTSCFLLKADLGPITNVTVTNNKMSGGGYSFYWYDSNDYTKHISNGTITNNRFMRSPNPGGVWAKGGFYGPTSFRAVTPPTTWSGNVWDDNNEVINM